MDNVLQGSLSDDGNKSIFTTISELSAREKMQEKSIVDIARDSVVQVSGIVAFDVCSRLCGNGECTRKNFFPTFYYLLLH